MEKKMIIALALSLVVLFAFQKINGKRPTPTADLQSGQPQTVATEHFVNKPDIGISKELENENPVKKEYPEETVVVETEQYAIEFSDIGGSVKKWRLKGFEDNGTEEVLIKEDAVDKRLFAMKSPSIPGLTGGKYKVNKGPGYLEFVYQGPEKVKVTKKYSFQDTADSIDLDISIENLSGEDKNISYILVGPSGVQDSGGVKGRSFLEADLMTQERFMKKGSVKGTWTENTPVSWVAVKSRYFAVILKPSAEDMYAQIQGNKKEGFLTAVGSPVTTVYEGAVTTDRYFLYAGPMDDERLASYGYGFESVIDYGWFGGISKILLTILRVFHKGIKNWGVAIILLTVLVNLISFPLTKKSFTSMQRMKNVQPHMQKLKELHKDNPQKLNKEMMELYKKYNVNPFGGCLPMLLQIPIFIALYQALMKAVELKGASFLWIRDLSRPDAVHLPFSLPVLGPNINILPLLMVIMMFLQQKVQGTNAAAMTDDQASQQKIMMLMMPVFFGFLFYGMPSGLVLYWLTNTILMTSEQLLLKRTID